MEGEPSVSPNTIPFHIAIVEDLDNRVPFCSGALISPNYVLTSARCVSGRSLTSFWVTFGEHDDTAAGDGQHSARVSGIFQHPEYHGPENSNYDFTLLKLAEAVKASKLRHVGLACLPADTSEMFIGAEVTVSGWTSIESDSKLSARLQISALSGISKRDCQNILRHQEVLDQHICLGGSNSQLCLGFNGGVNIIVAN